MTANITYQNFGHFSLEYPIFPLIIPPISETF